MASVRDRAHQSLMEGIAGESSSTAALILEAAVTILARDGYQSLTARHVAEEAGTNLALINYYFGGKQGLLLAVYDVLERQRYERQTQMYGDPDEPLSVKWRRAVGFYRQDLENGFVRVHHELMIQGLANSQLAERARQRIRAWNDLLIEVAEHYLAVLGVNVSPSLLVPAFTAFWYGMEQQHLIGMREEETPYFELLQRIGDWLEAQERDAQRQTVTG